MKLVKTTLLLLLFACPLLAAGQNSTGTIRGTVLDGASGQSLPGAVVAVLHSDPAVGVSTDPTGHFALKGLAVGRYDIQISSMGYEPAVFRELMVTSGKEVVLEISLRENVQHIEGVVVRPRVNKEAPLNPMALAGGRMLSMEEANRYAGGFDDPARLVTAFAGVAGSTSSNSISIRGNSPQFLQWRIEGVEAVNPTHFSDITGVGGGILTAFSSRTLGNSDFFTGAFPAEYGNALSGVFDMQLRSGNNQRFEHAAQIGTLGIEATSEGPLGRPGVARASYLVNYRYSTMALAGDLLPGLVGDAAGMRYQDLTFKFNLPTRRAGTFSIWAIGLKDHYIDRAPKDTSEWEDDWSSDADFWQTKAVGGIGHRVTLGSKSYLKSALAANYTENAISAYEFHIDDVEDRHQNADMTNTNWNLSFDSYLNTKFSAAHTNRTGIGVTGLFYNLDYKMPEEGMNGHDKPLIPFARSEGGSVVFSAFSQSQFRIGDRLTANVGLHATYFRLNDKLSIEPRASFRWQVVPRHALSLAFGMHSRRENLDYYFVQTPATGDRPVNKNLDFSKAIHVVLAYDWSISERIHLKIEPYFQHLYDIPVGVGDDAWLSVINYNDFWMMHPLASDGKGRNYGVDVTLERYLHAGWYYLISASLFESRYMDGDGVWRNTRLNRNYVVNALGGKEWIIRGKHMLSVSLRMTLLGGERYIPFDVADSEAKDEMVYDYTRSFEPQYKPQLIGHFSVGYKINGKKVAHTITLQMINFTGSKEYYAYFNVRKDRPMRSGSAISIPNISYKIEF